MSIPLMASSAGATEFTLENSAGYDGNPSRTNGGKGSGFTFHRAAVSRDWDIGCGADFTGLLEGSFKNYTSVGDNYFLKARGELSRPVLNGRIVPALLMEANAYRDDYIREDDRDQLLGGLRLTWIASRFFNVSLEGAFSRLNYKHAYYSFAEPSDAGPATGVTASSVNPENGLLSFANRKSGASLSARNRNGNGGSTWGGNGGSGRNGYGWNGGSGLFGPAQTGGQDAASLGGSDLQDLAVVKSSRNDHLASGMLHIDLFLSPSVSAGLGAGYDRLHSTDEFETYRQLHALAWVGWEPAPQWRLRLDAGLWRTAYDQSPLPTNRTDKTFSAGARLSRFFGPFELYGAISWLKNNSIINSEFYHQTVTQCGLSWYF